MSTPISDRARYWFDRSLGTRGGFAAPGRESLLIPGPTDSIDWGEFNSPATAYTSTDEFTRDWPTGLTQRTLAAGTPAEFWDRLNDTVLSTPGTGRVVVELPDELLHLSSFRMIGASGDPTYSFGFWFPRLQGFLGPGPGKSIIQMDANSMTTAQLDRMKTMPEGSSGNPLQQGFCRIDGTQASPVLIAGVTFQAADQQLLTAVSTSAASAVFTPTPAPHTGPMFYANSGPIATNVSYSQFLGAGRALNSQPPFECANLHTGKGYHKWHHLDIDGRRAASIDPARPRRCAPFLINSEYRHEFTDSWVHHSALSRYAANDQNSAAISGLYYADRVKFEEISNTQNRDPALNGGNSLGGYTNASLFGWETTNAEVRIQNSILNQDNPYTNGQPACHFQFTHVGSIAQKQGGRAYLIDNTYNCSVWPWMDGYCTIRIAETTYWWTDGFDTTIQVINDGKRKAPLVVPKTVAWPPTQAWLASQGATPTTHYLIRPA